LQAKFACKAGDKKEFERSLFPCSILVGVKLNDERL